ncbi:BTB/POZ domain-containing protein 9-like, partial [Centruroides sculpturatus]|uniref:BTB/POZ domain-containing protein 9-like n=1 Tax=Centruroides sculpturatus TaxID=218467 RepID=UPI000C6E7429
FRALLYGGMRESSQDVIELKGTSLVAFKILLRYIYTGRMTLTNLKEDMILDILGLAHQYGFVELETSISEYLKAILNIRNVCMIYDTANLFHLSSLAEVCCCFVDKHAQEIIQHESFLSLSSAAVKEMISRDSFCAPEVDIFRAVYNWTQHNSGIEPQEILSCVRLPLMTLQDLLNIVRPTGLVKADIILDAIKSRTESRDTDLKYRGYLIISYAYYIEVSMDQKDWIRVVDHTRYLCHSWQNLYFDERVVKYIRIVGTHNTVNRVFHVVAFECMYTNKFFRLEKGLIVPNHNVATITSSACVIEGVSRSRNALINGDTENYDWDSGYTCHQLGSGAIVIQLAQPYMIDSMRLLLWDCDDRSYSYYVEVSIDQQHWTMVADKQSEKCKSWQTICFAPRPVVFIRIVGTHNTANEVFHCVHFECPAQTSAASTPPLQETPEDPTTCDENVEDECTKYSPTSPFCHI